MRFLILSMLLAQVILLTAVISLLSLFPAEMLL